LSDSPMQAEKPPRHEYSTRGSIPTPLQKGPRRLAR
jgi:hypothetical protein